MHHFFYFMDIGKGQDEGMRFSDGGEVACLDRSCFEGGYGRF